MLMPPSAHLGDVEVDIEALPVAFHLPHPHLAGQVTGAGADALQGEGAVQVLLGAVPDMIKGDLLRGRAERLSQVCPALVVPTLGTLSGLTW